MGILESSIKKRIENFYGYIRRWRPAKCKNTHMHTHTCVHVFISRGFIWRVSTLNHRVYCGLLVAGSAWRVWLWLRDKAQVNVFPALLPGSEKEPGFPLVGGETDTRNLTG